MNELIVDRIKKDFPELVWQGSVAEWGIECGTGWGLLVYSFLHDAKVICDKSGGVLVITQIKNKLGTLRLYCHLSGGASKKKNGQSKHELEQYGQILSFRRYPRDSAVRDLATYYEQASAHVCELCGKNGHIDGDVSSRLMPLCHPHAELVRKSGPADAPDEFKRIDLDAANFVIARIDEMAQDGRRR